MRHPMEFLLGLLLVVLAGGGVMAQQYDQVQARVYERVDTFMSYPVLAMDLWSDFFHLDGFPNDLQPADRDVAVSYMYSVVTALKEETNLKVYYGLENGLFLGYTDSNEGLLPVLNYREPGNSGYDPTNNITNLAIYWNVCLDHETGQETTCQMNQGDSYIACVNDCEVIPCQDEDSQQDCSLLANSEQQAECESNMKWCINYSIQQVPEGVTWGYVPRTLSCIDSQGRFSQTPGEVLVVTQAQDGLELGNCVFESGALVTRELSGPFAYCEAVSGGFCNTTYIGVFRTRDYDPRLRPWYINVKEFQRPLWSDLYVFASSQELGISYSQPVYTTDEQGRNLLAGVLSSDLTLDAIADFLVDSYQDSDVTIGIYEDVEPFNMIGVSTGSAVAKSVLIDDPTQECTVDQSDSGLCMVARVPITDLDATAGERVFRNAHDAFQAGAMDPDEILTVKEDDEPESTAYIAAFVFYEQLEANLRWRIALVTPLEHDPNDAIVKKDSLFDVLIILAGVGFIICMVLFVLFFRKRKERAIVLADYRFTSAFILGCAIVNLSSFTLLGENRDELCMGRMWAFFMLSSIALSPLFVKAFRTWKLLGSPASASGRVQMSNFQAWIRTLPIPFTQAVILTVFSLVDPPRTTEDINFGGSVPKQRLTCQHDSSAFYITQAVYNFLLFAVGCVLAFLTRNIDPRFGDAKALLFAMYNIAFTVIMFAAIFSVVDISISGRKMMQTIGIFWATVFSSSAFVIPKLMEARDQRRKNRRKMSLLRKQSMAGRLRRYNSRGESSNMHDADEALKVLICSANVGNAEPTLASMKGWIPENGRCDVVTTLNRRPIEAERFDLVVIGMQESTWSSKKKKKKNGDPAVDQSEGFDDDDDDDTRAEESNLANMSMDEEDEKKKLDDLEENVLAAVRGEDTVALEKMEKTILGEDYTLLKTEIRGQMRLHIWALKPVEPLLEDVKVSGCNTGIGNVLANKGGIVISLTYRQTRLTFLSAHLAAHEGESYYKARCDNVNAILQASKTFELSQLMDVAVSSHHMFVFGDLNFRTKFEEKAEHEENVRRALELVEAKDYDTLYSFDELHKGVKNGDLLVGFNTLPCRFPPTFKVQREPGFVYKQQRTPSYTDRILYKSSEGLDSNVLPLAYEPCVDFITSDHKPIRGAFSIAPNDLMEPEELVGKFRMVFSEIECSDLPAADVEGYSDPYVMFVWDSIQMADAKKRGFRMPKFLGGTDWPRTSYKTKNLNPKWENTEITLVSTSHDVSPEAMLYVTVFDYDFASKDDILGTVPLNILQLVSMGENQSYREIKFDRPLEAGGRFAGRIKFKLEVSMIIG